MTPAHWPETPEELETYQQEVAELASGVDPWHPSDIDSLAIGGLFAALPTGLRDRDVVAGTPSWCAAVTLERGRTVASAVVRGPAGAPYTPGYLALQLGPLLEEVVKALDPQPDVVLVNATGRDHPRRAGLALHLGAVVELPTIGVTDRPLIAQGSEPDRRRWSVAPLRVDGEVVGFRVRTKRATHPIVVHAAWRTDADTALAVVRAACGAARTPEPLRQARQLARTERARDEGRGPPGHTP